MKKEIAEKWRKALNSGNYEQCKHALITKNEDGTEKYFCCLGVLSMLYLEEHPNSDLVLTFKNGEGYFGIDSSYLPLEVQEWAGMKSSNGLYQVPFESPRKMLSRDNDGGKTFKEIAIIIKENVDIL